MRIIETLSRTVIVDADDLDEATDKARSAYDSNEVILEADDFEKCEIIPASWTKNGIVPDGRDTKFFTHILGKTNTRIHYLYRDASNYKVREIPYLSSDDILFFKENIARIFKDKALVKMIYKFKMHREQEMKNLTAAISTTEEIDTTLSGYYMDMILEMVRKEEKPDDVAVENKKSIKPINDEKSLKPISKKKPKKAVSDNKCSWFMTPDMSVFDKD